MIVFRARGHHGHAGTRTTGPDFNRFFARDGFAMASIEYRLTPSITFPANVEDIRAAAVRWLKANAAAHALNADRICLWGSSAGAHLVAVAGLAPPGMFEGPDNPTYLSSVRCVLDGYGPTRFDAMDAQTEEERASLQPAVVTINVGDGAWHAAAAGASQAIGAPRQPASEAEGDQSRMTTLHHQSRGAWSVRPSRAFRTGSALPAR